MTPRSSWLSRHLSTFVRPHLRAPLPKGEGDYSWPEPLLKKLLKAWVLAKEQAGDTTILLPGRDVWLLEVLARLERWKTRFHPELSGNVSCAIGEGAVKFPDVSTLYCVDTGYSGTVPKALGVKRWNLISGKHPLRGLLGAGHLATRMESTPTYWTHAYALKGKPTQAVAKHNVLGAALATRRVATFALDHRKDWVG